VNLLTRTPQKISRQEFPRGTSACSEYAMDTLYELLGALPKDDAESLRVAFRRAVKGAHPDIRPGDPDAAVRFRQIVRANEILGDREQRAAYDHLLTLAQIEKDPAAAHPIAAKIHKLASGVLALASVSIVSVGGYLLFMHLSIALVAPTGSFAAASSQPATSDLTTRLSASIAAVSPLDAPDPAAVSAFRLARSDAATTGLAASPSTALLVAAAPGDADNTAALAGPSLGEPAAEGYANLAHARGVSAPGSGDISGALAELDSTAQLDPKFVAPYVDRGILFFRERKDERAFPDLPPMAHADKPSHAKSLLATSIKPKPDALPKVVPLPQPRTWPRFVTPRRPSRYAYASQYN